MSLIPEGYYPAVVERTAGEPPVQFGYSSRKKTKQVLVHFRITEGEYKGRVLPWFGYFTDATWKRTVESLRYCGFKGDDLSAVNSQPLDQVVSLAVEHDTDDKGNPRARVAWVNRSGGGTIQLQSAMDASELRGFAAAMKSRIAAIGEVDGDRANDTGTTDSTAGDLGWGRDDDIPF